MIHVTCRLTAEHRDELRNHTLGNRVWATFTFFRSQQPLTQLLSTSLMPTINRAYPDLIITNECDNVDGDWSNRWCSHVHGCHMRTSLQWVPRMQCCLTPAWWCLFSSVYDYGWPQSGWMESLQCACHLLCPPLMLWVHHSFLATVFQAALLTGQSLTGIHCQNCGFHLQVHCNSGILLMSVCKTAHL